MKKYQKQMLLDEISKIDLAYREMEKAGRQGSLLSECDRQNIKDMLCECQQTAIQLGEMIERQEGEGHITVSYMEEYCESLFSAFESVADDNVNIRKIHKNLKRQLIRIENSIKNDISVKTEVVFLPYKASMWDSLESVWKAAREDEECDTYVIPIPYFDKNPDGSLGAMHYEGNKYPAYVPVTDWKEYNIKERKPDVTFIHNPYDNSNFVTSVHPAFYASELKKHTDMLVYIPYFVGINNKVEKHLCVVPGVLFADKVIVESEKVRATYLAELHQFENEYKCQGKFGDFKKKILALGSPKMDRMRTVRKQDMELPERWEFLVQACGGKKKIILYNTTIAAMLKYGNRYLDKLESVLCLLKENREIILWWRPHPLLAATLQSMRVELFGRYQTIVDKYKEEGWGIYDDTADVERAVAFSDAYYGDMSSVVELYRTTGKPIMIQNCQCINIYEGDVKWSQKR